MAAGDKPIQQLDFTATWLGIASILIFILAYSLVIGEEFLHLRKSKPVMVAAGIIWVLVAIALGYIASIAVHFWISGMSI